MASRSLMAAILGRPRAVRRPEPSRCADPSHPSRRVPLACRSGNERHMEILLVVIVLAVIAAAAFLYMRSRGGASALSGRGRGDGPALRGARGARAAARHD